jgi:hypothetical protein
MLILNRCRKRLTGTGRMNVARELSRPDRPFSGHSVAHFGCRIVEKCAMRPGGQCSCAASHPGLLSNCFFCPLRPFRIAWTAIFRQRRRIPRYLSKRNLPRWPSARPPNLLEKGQMVTDDVPAGTTWKAANGIRLTGMPAFAGSFSNDELCQVSLLLAHADKLPRSAQDALTLLDSGSAAPWPARATYWTTQESRSS